MENFLTITFMIPPFLETILLAIIDFFYGLYPQKTPSIDQLKGAKLVSHRGERDNISVFENTLESIGIAVQNGIWGVEFDIRWTKDLVPIVFHDPTADRVFNKKITIKDQTFLELRENLPLIPSLEEVVEKFGKKIHFLIEIKKEEFPFLEEQKIILKKILSPLEEQSDYHTLTLNPETLPLVDFLKPGTKLLVAELNFKHLLTIVEKENLGGLLGHYLFLGKRTLEKLQIKDQILGTGYVRSKNLFFREVNRGVHWIFSNHAVEVEKMRKELIQKQET